MKITLNLSPAASWRDRYALAWTIPAIVIGLAVLILLGRSSLREYREYRLIGEQLADLELRSAELARQEAAIRNQFEDAKSRQLLVQTNFVNSLIKQREVSVAEVSSRVAGLLPGDAQLTGLSLISPKKPGDDFTVRIGIDSRSEDSVETFINDLEDSQDFKDVAIMNQGFLEDTPQGEQVSVVCTARYLPGAKEPEETQEVRTPASDKAKAAAQQPRTARQKLKTGNKRGRALGQPGAVKPQIPPLPGKK
jgi:hypothetical protein